VADFFNTLDRPQLPAPDSGDQGFLSWSNDPAANVNQTTQTAGVLYGTRLEIRRQMLVTSVVLFCSTQGATLTSGQNFVGLYTSAGVRIGVSADQTTPWGTTGVKTAALASGPFVVNPGYVWAVLVANGDTPPKFGVGSLFSVGVNAGLAAAGTRFASQASAQTALPASLTPGSWLQNANAPWAAIS
jgi:hypothetical protein